MMKCGFIHSCLSLGRLDVLRWYEQAFYDDGGTPLDKGLGRYLSSGKWNDKLLPRVFCSPSEKFSVGDCLEVLGRCRTTKETCLDGSWVLHGWDPFSNRTHAVKIENGVCRSDRPSLDGAALGECESTNGHGSVHLLFRANGGGEYWYSSHVNQSIDGAVGMICLKRKTYPGSEIWAENGRQIVLTKIEDATGDVGDALIWQRAGVVASNEQDLTIEFDGSDPPIQETMSHDSSRINLTGSYKLHYLCGSLVLGRTKDEAQSVLVSGLDLARRYGHEHIVQWIEEGVSRDKLETYLTIAEREFLKQFFSNSSAQDLNQAIEEAAVTASPMRLSEKEALVVSHLQDELYVLGHWWMSQKRLQLHGDVGCGYNFRGHSKLGLFRCAARFGRLDRVERLMGHGFDSNSEIATRALFDAAYGNHVHIVQALLAKGVDGTGSHAFVSDGDEDRPIGPDYTLLELAVQRLSGDVVSFLLGQGHVPSNESLLGLAVRPVYLSSSDEAPTKDRMAADRLSILQQLVSAGLGLANFSDRIMGDALHSLEGVLQQDKMPSSHVRITLVPVTREVICWLCAHGCDLASTIKRDSYLRSGEVRVVLADLVQLSETVWPVADAISHAEPFDEIERLVQRSGMSIHAIRDPLGRTPVQVAVLSDRGQHLEWLVTAKGVKLDEEDLDGLNILELARQNGLPHIVDAITRLRQLSQH